MTTETFLETFFGPGNDIRHEQLVSGALGAHGRWLDHWIQRLNERSPTVLPRDAAGHLTWYGLAFDESSAAAQRAELAAWIGPSFTDFEGQPSFTPDDQFEITIDEFTGGHWLRLRVGDGFKDRVRETLELMRNLDVAKPLRAAQTILPTGRLLRDFEWALRRKDAGLSKDILSALESAGQISAMNLSYLRVQRLSQIGLLSDLLALRDLPDVISTRRPTRVTAAILHALHGVHLERRIAEDDFQGALDSFENDVAGKFNALFGSPSPASGVEELRMHMAWAALTPQKPALRDELLSIADRADISDRFLDWTSNRITPSETQRSDLDLAEAAIHAGAFSAALAHLRSSSDGLEHAQLALRCAFETEHPDDAMYAMGLFGELTEDDRITVRSSRSVRMWIDALERAIGRPDSWPSLIEAVNGGTVTAQDLSYLEQQIERWPPHTLLDDSPVIVAGLLFDRDPPQDAILRSLLPSLLTAVDNCPGDETDPRIHPILSAVSLLLMIADGRSDGDLETLLDLTEVLLVSADSDEHDELIGELIEVWQQEESQRRLPWLLDLAELVASAPRRTSAAGAAFAAVFVEAVSRRHQQMSAHQRRIALDVLAEFGVPTEGLIPDEVEEGELARPSQDAVGLRKVGVYTLTPGVGQRAADIIESQYQGVTVVVNDDKVSTDRLVSLSREADVMLVVRRSATHSATDAIREARPSDKPIVYSPGKGSSSLLAAFEQHLQAL